MNDESIVDRDILSNRAAAEALQIIAGEHSYAGGSALLNASAYSTSQIDDKEVDLPIVDRPKVDRFAAQGNYPISFEHLSDDEDDLSLTNDVAIEEESDFAS